MARRPPRVPFAVLEALPAELRAASRALLPQVRRPYCANIMCRNSIEAYARLSAAEAIVGRLYRAAFRTEHAQATSNKGGARLRTLLATAEDT